MPGARDDRLNGRLASRRVHPIRDKIDYHVYREVSRVSIEEYEDGKDGRKG